MRSFPGPFSEPAWPEGAGSADVWPRWARGAGLGALADHVVASHHAWLRCELPRLHGLLWSFRDGDGQELGELRRAFGVFRGALEPHLDREEDAVFPLCRQLETAGQSQWLELAGLLPSIGEMEMEHRVAWRALGRLRSLSDDFSLGNAARRLGEPWEAWMGALAELEADTLQHIRKENSLLFPLAIERGRVLRGAPARRREEFSQ